MLQPMSADENRDDSAYIEAVAEHQFSATEMQALYFAVAPFTLQLALEQRVQLAITTLLPLVGDIFKVQAAAYRAAWLLENRDTPAVRSHWLEGADGTRIPNRQLLHQVGRAPLQLTRRGEWFEPALRLEVA